MHDLVLETCKNILLKANDFRKELVTKIIDFGKKQQGFSARTADVVKGVEVLATQLYCLLQLDNLPKLLNDESEKEWFTDPQKL